MAVAGIFAIFGCLVLYPCKVGGLPCKVGGLDFSSGNVLVQNLYHPKNQMTNLFASVRPPLSLVETSNDVHDVKLRGMSMLQNKESTGDFINAVANRLLIWNRERLANAQVHHLCIVLL